MGYLTIISGCNKQELIPSNQDENMFDVNDGDESMEARLRQSFFQETGCYVIFSDTLRKGMKEKIININYDVTISGSNYYDSSTFKFRYLNTDEQKLDVIAFIKEKILSYTPKKELPYSMFLLDTIVEYTYNSKTKDYDYDNPKTRKTIVEGMYTMAIARMKNISQQNSKFKKTVQCEIMSSLIKSTLKKIPEDKFEVYYSYSLPYYDKYYDSENQSEMPKASDMKELGFLKAFIFNPPNRMSFYAKDRDKSVFIDELLKKHESVWRSEYENFPLVIRKLEELTKLLIEKGYSLEYLKES